MPSLTDAHRMTEKNIIYELTSTEHSEYFQVNHDRLSTFLTPSNARRYLYHLILLNSKNKTGLYTIEEEIESKSSSSYEAKSSSHLNRSVDAVNSFNEVE